MFAHTCECCRARVYVYVSVCAHASVHGMRVCPLRCSDTHYPSPPLFSATLGTQSYSLYSRQTSDDVCVYVCVCVWVCGWVGVCINSSRAQGLKSVQRPVAVILVLKPD